MALLPSIASTLAFSMPAGPVGMVWVSIHPLFLAILCSRIIANSGRVCILGRLLPIKMLNVRKGWLAASFFIMLVGLAMVCIYKSETSKTHVDNDRPIWLQQCRQPEVYISGHTISQVINGAIR